MACKCYKDGLGHYIDGDLDREQRQEIEDHLAACEDCASHVGQIQTLRGMLKGLPPIQATESFHFVLRDRIRRELAQQQRRASFSYVLTHRMAPAMALGGVVLVGSFWMLTQKTDLFHRGNPSAVTAQNTRAPHLDPSTYDNVRYVIDDYGDAVVLDRNDAPAQRRVAASDSMRNEQRPLMSGARAAQVSF